MEGLPDGDWHFELITPDLYQAERIKRVHYSGRTPYQEVVVQDGAAFGMSLVLDGKTQSTEVDEFAYHEGLVHPAMIAHPEPRSVFVAGGGEGATIRETLKHNTVQSAVMVDIDKEVVDLCREHLPRHHQGSFDDPRLRLVHADAYAYLEETGDLFDVAIIDVPDPLEVGPAYLLYTREFYSLVKSRLTAQGLVVVQAGPTGPSFYEQCFSAVANTMASVFPTVTLSETFVPAFGSTWGFVIGSLGSDPYSLTVEEVDNRLATRGIAELRYFDGVTLKGMTRVPKYLRESVANERRIITRDSPLFVI